MKKGHRSPFLRWCISWLFCVPLVGAAPVAEPVRGPAPANPAHCPNWVAEYALAARLRLTDTPFGAGDGVYDIGPGRLKIGFSSSPEANTLNARVLAYEMRNSFTVESHVMFIRAKVTTRAESRATPDARGVVATGTLTDQQLTWSLPFHGHRTDGTLFCEGLGCGFPGIPPSGQSPLHIPPSPVKFGRFSFDSPNLLVFRMDYVKVAHTEMPRQTAFVSISGRQTSRECVPAMIPAGS